MKQTAPAPPLHIDKKCMQGIMISQSNRELQNFDSVHCKMKWDSKKRQAALYVLQCFHHKNRTEGAAMSHTHFTTTTRSYKHLDPYRGVVK